MSKRKSPANPLGLDGLTPEEIDRLSNENEKHLATRNNGTALASMALPGPLRNPGFDVVPWVPRQEIEGHLGKYCPKHLHVLSEIELDESHYPYAQRDDTGACARFCWACGRPTRMDGLSGMGHKGTGKPCPACGYKRKRVLNENALRGLKKGQDLLAQARAEGYTSKEVWSRVAEIAPRDGVAEEKRQAREVTRRRGQGNVPTLTELMQLKANDRAEKIMQPYFDALALEPKDDWSPSTKLEFYNGQTAIAEKVLNRLEGLPVARHRHVDKDDEDVIPEGELSPRVVAKLVANILADTAPEDLIEDAEFAEVEE